MIVSTVDLCLPPLAQVIQILQSSQPPLLPAHRAVCKVLRLLGERMVREERETLAMKLHCLAFVIEQCGKSDPTTALKLWVISH